MNKLLKLVIVGAIFVGVGGAILVAPDAYAINVFQACTGQGSTVCSAQNDNAASMVKTVINILLYVLGIIAVIMIIIGGIRYTTSNGDSGSLKTAKDTILYSVVGLVVAIMSYAIVNFVVGRF